MSGRARARARQPHGRQPRGPSRARGDVRGVARRVTRSAAAILAGAAALGAIDALLRVAGGRFDPRQVIRTTIEVEAPIDHVWAVVADLPGQPRWMHDLKQVWILTPGPVGRGTRAVGRVRMFGIGVDDPIEVTAWEPPVRFGLRHAGRFEGSGEIRLTSLDPARTRVEWDEVLVAPVLPGLAGLLARPLFGRIFATDLRRLGELAEADRRQRDAADR